MKLNWQKDLPDSPGDWLWIIMWECNCCVYKTGIAWIINNEEEPNTSDSLIRLPSGLLLSWENQKPYENTELEEITAWCKIELPNFD